MTPPGPSGRGRTVKRTDRRAYAFDDVIRLIRAGSVRLTEKAQWEAARFFDCEKTSIGPDVRDMLEGLQKDEWEYRQVENGEWADIYRVEVDPPPPAFIKLAIEGQPNHQFVKVFSFHNYDDT